MSPAAKRIAKLAVLLAVLAGAIALFRWIGPEELQGRLRAAIVPLGPAAPAVFVAAYGICAAALVPCTPFNLLGGVLFGNLWGFLWNWSGSMLAATIAFWGARWLGRDAVARALPRSLVERFDAAAERHGFSLALYPRAMQIPFGPVNLAAGVSGMRFLPYLLGTGLGILPGIFVWTCVADAAASVRSLSDLLDRRFLVPFVLFAVVLAIPVLVRKLRPPGRPPLLLALVLPLLVATQPSAPPWKTRGDEVEAAYKTHVTRLRAAYDSLLPLLEEEAPDLHRKLAGEPPAPVAHGYQIVPKLAQDTPAPAVPPRVEPRRFSWPLTGARIRDEATRTEELARGIAEARAAEPSARRPLYERLVALYQERAAAQRLADSQIQYNRLWQKTIAEDVPRFDRQTKLLDLALERQGILDSLRAASEGEREAALRARAAGITRELREHTAVPVVAPFLRLETPDPRTRVVVAPVYTDIRDDAFVEAFRTAVESAWRVEDGGDLFRLRLEVRRIATAGLYRDAGRPAPADGEHIAIDPHVARFPADGGVLTTGANSTYAIPRRYIALGPQPIAPHVLAHEFGHVLGLVDGYLRGYRDLGADGYEVSEVVPEPEEIMNDPAAGRVFRWHFERILALLPDRPSVPGN